MKNNCKHIGCSKYEECNYKQKKAQSIMDWLVTYGFAILAGMIAIGFLAYFGVFKPSNYAQNQEIKVNENKILCEENKGIYYNDRIVEECCVELKKDIVQCLDFRKLNNSTYLVLR